MDVVEYLSYIAVGFFASGILLKFIRLWLLEDEQKSITKFAEQVDKKISSISSEKLILSPIEFTNLFLDYFFGKRLFRCKIFKIISLVSILLVISTVILISITNSDENEREFPWQMFSFSLDKIKPAKEIEPEKNNIKLEKLQGSKIALGHIDEIIPLIRNSKNYSDARQELKSKFGLSDTQAGAILQMQIKKLSAYERFKFYNELDDEKNLKSDNISESSNQIEDKIDKRKELLSTFNTPFWSIIYTIIYILLCTFIAGLLGIISLSITRQFAREMVFAKGLLTLVSAVILNLILIILIAPAFTIIITIFSIPMSWVYYDILLIIPELGALWGSIALTTLSSIISIFGWYLVIPAWTKAILIISFIPWLCFVFLLILEAISYIFKKPIHLTIARLLKLSLEHKGGPIGFVSALFFGFSGLIYGIIRLL